MSRIGNNLDPGYFLNHQLDTEFQTATKQIASPSSQSFEQLAEVLRRQSGLRLVSAEAPIVAPPPSAADQAIQKIQEDFANRFAELAADPEKFHSMMKEVYGSNYDHATAEAFRQRALAGDFSWLPKIEFESDEVLRGGHGAYDASRNVVYINEKFLDDPETAAQIYSEEVGAYLDTQLNTSDTVGDEGEMFRRLLHGEQLSATEKAAIRADDDHGVIYVNGKATEVEFWFGSDFVDAVADGAKAVGGAIVDGANAVGGAIVDGAKAVGGAIVDGAKAVGGAIADAAGWAWGGIQSIASAVWGAASWIGDKTWQGIKYVGEKTWDGIKWVGKGIKKAAKWIGPRLWDAARGIGTGVWDAVKGIGRNLWEAAGTFGRGFGKLFKGDVKGFFKDMGSGLLKLVQTPVDAILMVGGRVVSAVQTLIGIEPVGRKLTDAEIAELRKVYGDSIDYSSVRIKEGSAGLFSLTGRAFTHGDTIYIPKDNLPLTTDLLVHEMGHVWQHQNGGTDYMSEALVGQYLGEKYDFEKGIKEGKSWSELNPEQQAELLQQAYKAGFFNGSTGGKFVYNGTDYTDYLNEALRQVRAGEGAP